MRSGIEHQNSESVRVRGGKMPQGGSGKCGGNLMSSGNSKKKMSTKQRVRTSKGKAPDSDDEGGEDGTASAAHTLIRPSKEKRAAALRAQRKAIEAEEKPREASRLVARC
jgi:hypothetical protein